MWQFELRGSQMCRIKVLQACFMDPLTTDQESKRRINVSDCTLCIIKCICQRLFLKLKLSASKADVIFNNYHLMEAAFNGCSIFSCWWPSALTACLFFHSPYLLFGWLRVQLKICRHIVPYSEQSCFNANPPGGFLLSSRSVLAQVVATWHLHIKTLSR